MRRIRHEKRTRNITRNSGTPIHQYTVHSLRWRAIAGCYLAATYTCRWMSSREIAAVVASHRDAFVRDLQEWVDIDSGSFTPIGVNRLADRCEERLHAGGWEVERLLHHAAGDEEQLGDLIVARLPADGPSTMLIGHLDTVFHEGAAAERPFRTEGTRAYGPGAYDMKSGVLAAMCAVEVLQELGLPTGNLTFVCNPDEEVGSPFSGDTIKGLAQVADAALVMEGAREDGSVVSARKGVTDFEIEIIGRAAHAGVEPERGRSAVLEASHKVIALHALPDRWPGVSVNVGVIEGGERPNVVADRCRLHVDVRAPSEAALESVEAELERICREHVVHDVDVVVQERQWHRPMERTEGTRHMVSIARDIAEDLGFDLGDAATGGASDANTTSAAGVPTLDGLGLVGGDAHSEAEWVDLESVVPRVTLIAGLLTRIATQGVPR